MLRAVGDGPHEPERHVGSLLEEPLGRGEEHVAALATGHRAERSDDERTARRPPGVRLDGRERNPVGRGRCRDAGSTKRGQARGRVREDDVGRGSDDAPGDPALEALREDLVDVEQHAGATPPADHGLGDRDQGVGVQDRRSVAANPASEVPEVPGRADQAPGGARGDAEGPEAVAQQPRLALDLVAAAAELVGQRPGPRRPEHEAPPARLQHGEDPEHADGGAADDGLVEGDGDRPRRAPHAACQASWSS